MSTYTNHDDAKTQQPIMNALLLIKETPFANQLKWKTPNKHDSVWFSTNECWYIWKFYVKYTIPRLTSIKKSHTVSPKLQRSGKNGV